ncbi:MAG: cobalt-precorrin-6A reductase [Alphaproteobacteria bacterium]
MPGRERARLLILGGTGEAAALASAAVAAFGDRLEVITSLAGRTRAPAKVAGTLRVGGFGGAGGLADYLARETIDLVVDATHPFAAEISSSARDACDAAGVQRLMLLRPPWRRQPGDDWVEVDDVARAAAVLAARGGRAFITVGVKELHHFSRLEGVFCLVRLIEPPPAPPPLADYAVVTGRGPFTVDAELALLAEHRIDCVVSKSSGGAATEAKIIAARELGLPVIMVRRPPLPDGERVTDTAAALAWISEHIAGG